MTRARRRPFEDPPSIAFVKKAIARGRPQWLRVPPPEVREVRMTIASRTRQ